MKARFSTFARFLSALCLVACLGGPRVAAQTPPDLGIQIIADHPTLSLTGTVGTVYSIQYATDISPTNAWINRTLLQAKDDGSVWTDPSAPSIGQRFYRAVSVPAPANPDLVFIQPGTFTMGSPTNEVDRGPSEGPQTVVTISRGFWMGKYEVSQGDYLSVVGSNPSWFNGDRTGEGGEDYGIDLTLPVEQVSWNDATNYCARLTAQELAAGRIPANCVYRLPTEAEWEYACRAGTTTRFYYGDDPGYTNLANYAWYADNSGNGTQPVGLLRPNAWGLYDMAGNVWEWCQDWYGPSHPGGSVTDPQGPVTGTARVWRGASWFYIARHCRSARRFNNVPTYTYDGLGFRVVLAAGQP